MCFQEIYGNWTKKRLTQEEAAKLLGVYTPKHGIWLNVAEVELNVMISQCLRRRIDNIEELREVVSTWQAHRDQLEATVNWQFTAKDARVKLERLYPTFNS